MEVPLSRPDITGKEKDSVLEVLSSPYLSMGPKVGEFEQLIADFTGRKYAVAVSSGTAALHLIIKALGIGKGDEVITTPFSFIASANCLLYEGAVPVFADIEPRTLNLDMNKVEAKITPRTRAILPVHVFGQPGNMSTLKTLAASHSLPVVEDSCEALGAVYKGTPAGGWGVAAAFAFYPNKQITTGEGGVVVTDSPEINRLCRSMRNQGRGEQNLWLQHPRLGYNYRMDELSAALGCAQMGRVREILVRRQEVADRYKRLLSGIRGVILPYVEPGVEMSWFVYVIRMEQGVNRDKVMDYLTDHGVQCRPYFTPIHLQDFYREQLGYREGDFPITEGVSKSTLALPFFNNITEGEMEYVAATLAKAVRQFGG
ncbi:MAG TPA: DegT/DnrJ/EryC1/StrS family aminotransferase [Bacillota bacterium]|nr:DegT/DnrJ/EryC1/StrS family aminotransferase [Bacillota bacterium]